jgi:CDP-glycerol glycerophosphotransferase
MKKIKLIVNLILNGFLYFIANLLPKNKKTWVFGAWFGQRYSDNPKAFFEYINHHQTHVNAIWISKDPHVIAHVRELGFKSYSETSLLGLWYQLRAKYAFVCQALQDDLYSPCIGKQTKVVNLWHGLPLKKIMYDVFGDKVNTKNKWGRFVDAITPYDKIRNDYLIATSIETQNTLSQAFRLPKNRTLITGFPRNDVLLKSSILAEDKLFECIYMPTFRGGMGTECDLFAQYGFDVQEIDATLKANHIALTLRMHPVNKPPKYIIEEISHSSNISIDSTADIFDTIADYDCMVTDYSGGYFDFILTGRPVLFAPFDLEKYKQQERDLYYSYEDVTLKPYAYNWAELIENIVKIKQEGASADYKQAYEVLQKRFHQPSVQETEGFSESLFKCLNALS